MATMQAALQAKEVMKEMLRDLPGINGIGVAWDKKGEPCVRVNVDFEISTASRNKIPSFVEGVPVLVEEMGRIQTE
jgi:hypothetical protein